MRTFHQHVLVAQNGLTATMGSTVDDHILANDVTVSNDTLRLLTTELKVLGQSTDDRTLMNLVLFSHTRTIHDTHEGEENATITNFHIVLDIDEGEYLTVIADFRLRTDFGFRGYFASHILYLQFDNLQLLYFPPPPRA